MKRSRYSDEQIAYALKQADSGTPRTGPSSPDMNDGRKLLWQQALLRGQLQMTVNLREQTYFQTHGRLVPELPTDDGVTYARLFCRTTVLRIWCARCERQDGASRWESRMRKPST